MAIFNYGNGVMPNYGYGYNNGNMSSTTNIINGVAVTQNVMNLGDNSSCSSGPNYCSEGYSIYVPCLKNITRGQNVCFNLYLTDIANQDTLDLNDVCGLTLSLTGPYGCPYGDYTWPDDISFLQGEELSEIKCEEFIGNICRFDVGYIKYDVSTSTLNEFDIEDAKEFINIKGSYGDFYEGEIPYIEANDSPTHIFLGWTTDERLSDICDNFNIDDVIVSTDNVWVWEEPLHEDIKIYAVYRKRRTYKVKVSYDNRHSYFMVRYGDKTYMLSDKTRDYVDVLEGYHFIATCYPITTKDRDDKIEKTYTFISWSDGYPYQSREYLVTNKLVNEYNEIRLLSVCEDDEISKSKSSNLVNDVDKTPDNFENNIPSKHDITTNSYNYYPSSNIYGYDGVNQIYNTMSEHHSYISIDRSGYLSFDCGCEIGTNVKVVLTLANNFGLRDGGSIIVKNGSQSISVDILSDEEIIEHEFEDVYTFEFNNCEDSVFTIETTFDELYLYQLCVFEKIITNKGLIELCIPPEDTIKFYVGVLNMSGAICVNDNWYGLNSVQVGVVNKLNPISININE